MNNHVDNEFNRILSNPENEIISESLKEKLKPQKQQSGFMFTFEGDLYESYLDSFSRDKDFFSISLVVSNEVVFKILSEEDFVLSSKMIEFSISSSDMHEISSFKIDGNSYILNIVVCNEDKNK